MILEALEYLTTPCPPWARRLGYLSEAIAIRHRARRCAGAWADHQRHTKAAILDHVPKDCGTAVILGAGQCLDVPLPDLAARCEQVILVDAVRLRGLRLPENADYRPMDVHGVAEKLYLGTSLWDRTDNPLREFDEADYVVSVNLLSQLPILPLRAMARRGLSTPIFEHGLSGQIMRDHVRDLKSLAAKSILIADARRITRDRKGAVVDDENLAAQALLPTPNVSWHWPIAPEGERHDGSTIEAQVGIWVL
ncbi:MAG: hypothetical protein JJ878_05740 [Alphaproteobacteria bacterium]|nr:hypothetical protein [Alphaproteobacteria bacterium]MBO6862122.1 hypothetical protein [Alphaproteobacteria bacterium]